MHIYFQIYEEEFYKGFCKGVSSAKGYRGQTKLGNPDLNYVVPNGMKTVEWERTRKELVCTIAAFDSRDSGIPRKASVSITCVNAELISSCSKLNLGL